MFSLCLNKDKTNKNEKTPHKQKQQKRLKKAFYILKITEQTCTIRENLKMILNFNYDIFSLLLREKTGQMFHQKL